MKKIAIIGLSGESIFMHLDDFPLPSVTVHAKFYHEEPGGKGYNQAVACRKLGCDVSYGFQYESSIGDCRCTSYPSDYGGWDDFEIFGVEKCTGYFEMTYGGCGRSSMMACARGKQIKRHTNKYCHVYNGSYSAWYANTEELCQFADGSVRTHKIPHPCWRGSSYEKSFRTMEDCEKYLATMPEYDDVYCYGACDHN